MLLQDKQLNMFTRKSAPKGFVVRKFARILSIISTISIIYTAFSSLSNPFQKHRLLLFVAQLVRYCQFFPLTIPKYIIIACTNKLSASKYLNNPQASPPIYPRVNENIAKCKVILDVCNRLERSCTLYACARKNINITFLNMFLFSFCFWAKYCRAY